MYLKQVEKGTMVYEPFPSKLKLEVRTDGTMRQHSPSWHIDTPQGGVQHIMIHLIIIEKRTGLMSAIHFLSVLRLHNEAISLNQKPEMTTLMYHLLTSSPMSDSYRKPL